MDAPCNESCRVLSWFDSTAGYVAGEQRHQKEDGMLITKRSMLTGVEHTLEIPCTPEQLADYRGGKYIQDAMPNVPAPLREFLMTGITPDEWNSLVGSEEDEEDGDNAQS